MKSAVRDRVTNTTANIAYMADAQRLKSRHLSNENFIDASVRDH